MKIRRILFKNCLNLTQTSESIGYCSYYGEVINFCRDECPHNYLVSKSKKSKTTSGDTDTWV
ncbi:MAG: hypothetical protein ACXADY_25950 [Candidatus Hodarchaeales archaeon]